MKWLSTKDKLPCFYKLVLVCIPRKDKTLSVDTAWMNQDGVFENDYYDLEVTHWMPLPEPPNK